MSTAAETEIPYLGLKPCQEFEVLGFGENSGFVAHGGCMHHLNTQRVNEVMIQRQQLSFTK